jgi:probable HAF family extracellular repeat protein
LNYKDVFHSRNLVSLAVQSLVEKEKVMRNKSDLHKAPLAAMAALLMVGSYPAVAQTTAQTRYKVTDVGPLGPLGYAQPYPLSYGGSGVNNAGQVVGYKPFGNYDFQGFFWQQDAEGNGSMTDLGAVTQAYAINDAGQVAGSDNGSAFIWQDTNSNKISDPDEMITYRDAGAAYALNKSGEFTGRGIAGDGNHAYIRKKDVNGNAVLIDLGTLGGYLSVGYGINDSSRVVGGALPALTTYHRNQHPFLWHDANNNGVSDLGEMIDIGNLGGKHSGDTEGAAFDINNSNQVVGYSLVNYGESGFAGRAFLWESGVGMINLGTLGTLGTAHSIAYGINDSSQVVGSADTGTGNDYHAFVWKDDNNNGFSDAGEMKDLNNLIPATDANGDGQPDVVLTEARGINYTGQIVVNGTYNGKEHIFLLTPETAVAAGATTFESGNIEFQLPAGQTTPQAVTIAVTPLNASAVQASLPVGQEALLALDISSNIDDLATTFPGMFPITLWFDVPFDGTASEFINLRILHGETKNGVYGLYDVTEAHDYNNRRISAKVDSFSPFVIVREVGPTINNVTVDKTVLRPANHQMVQVKVNYTATDNITGAASNSPSVTRVEGRE